MELLKDYKPGPLDHYRKLATFDWKKLRIFIETEEIIKFKHDLIVYLKNNPICHPSNAQLSLDELRHVTVLRTHYLAQYEAIGYVRMIDNTLKFCAMYEVLMQWDPCPTIKHSLDKGMFHNVVTLLGTNIHEDITKQIEAGKIIGCFALTEVAHGSNIAGMQTTATYEPSKDGFVLHSPSFESAKCWAGVLGQCATHVIVYAQLYTADGKHHGLQQFVAQIRDTDSLTPLPGVTIADLGPTIGLDGVDNGLILFNNYLIPKTSLLNRNGKINDRGQYVSMIKDKSQEKGTALTALSSGRLSIVNICSSYVSKAITIAVRYAAVRRQFGPGNEEVPILEYQTHQHRLLPYLAGAVVFKCISRYLVTDSYETAIGKITNKETPNARQKDVEMHAISSACKSVAGWFAKEAIQECREACGGHGYLKAAQFGELRNDNDANMTYEGENHVLIQQASKWLLKLVPDILQQKRIVTPYVSVEFLNNYRELLGLKCSAISISEMTQPEYVLQMYEWLVCYLLKISHEKHAGSLSRGKDPFWAQSDNQVYYNRNLAVAYIQHFILYRFLLFINEGQDPVLRSILTKILALYGLFNLEKHSSHLYQGGYFSEDKHNLLLQDSILCLCKDLKDDAVSIVDAIAPDDFLLNSILGYSDGQVYDHLKNSVFQGEGNLARPKWWHEILNSKL